MQEEPSEMTAREKGRLRIAYKHRGNSRLHVWSKLHLLILIKQQQRVRNSCNTKEIIIKHWYLIMEQGLLYSQDIYSTVRCALCNISHFQEFTPHYNKKDLNYFHYTQ